MDERAIARSALAARDAGRPEEGLRLLEPALAAQPGSALLLQVAGLLHRATGNSEAARHALARAAALAPADARIAHALARVTLEAGLPAVALFDRAHALAPRDGDILIGRSAAQLAEGRGKEAEADLARLVAASPGWLEGQGALADLRWFLGDHEDFHRGYEEALARDGSDRRLHMALLERLVRANRFDKAAAALARARQLLASDQALLAFEAVVADETGDHARAGLLFEQLAAVPDLALAARHMRHHLRTGQPELAARRGEPWLSDPRANEIWPYMEIAWRLLEDPRHAWLVDQPGLVAVHDAGLSPAELHALGQLLRRLHALSGEPAGQSVRSGTQTDGPLLARSDPEIRQLRSCLEAAIGRHVAALPADPTHPVLRHRPDTIRFAGSWSVRLAGAGHHSVHIHPQGWLSSAFYVCVPGTGEAGPPPSGWLALGAPPPELGLNLPPLHKVEPVAGQLVLFPSIFWHGTMPFAGGERMTVAFDVAPPR
ncbi:MAG: putative 2OG-Fe(II) oxygenase [Sphingomonadaceae bacterium]